MTGKILIAGVGYHNLRDLSFGPVLMDRLAQDDWPPGVEVADLSYSPIGVMHSLDEHGPYDRMIFVAGGRRHRPPGSVYCYRWGGQLPTPEEVQARVAEAVMAAESIERCRRERNSSPDDALGGMLVHAIPTQLEHQPGRAGQMRCRARWSAAGASARPASGVIVS